MIFISGTHVRRRMLGYTGVWCPVRSQLAPFRVIEVEATRHVYFVPLGRAKRLHFELVCPETSLAIALAASATFPVGRSLPDDGDLAPMTTPALLDAAPTLLLESESIANADTPPSDRIDAILHKLAFADFGLSRTSEGDQTVLWLVGAGIGLGVLGAAMMTLLSDFWSGVVLAAVAVVCGVLAALITIRDSKGARFKRMKPYLMASIRATNADDDEVEEALSLAKREKMKVHRYVRKAWRQERQQG